MENEIISDRLKELEKILGVLPQKKEHEDHKDYLRIEKTYDPSVTRGTQNYLHRQKKGRSKTDR